MNFRVPHAALAAVLEGMGCPAASCELMARQLDKRAQQLAEQKGRTYADALKHLLQLMSEGWAAKERGF